MVLRGIKVLRPRQIGGWKQPQSVSLFSVAMEVSVTRLQEKARGRTKQIVGQMIGDDKLVLEGKQEQRAQEKEAEEKADDPRAGDQRRE